MQFLAVLPLALAALVSAQDSSSSSTTSIPYSNDFTTLTTQTDSNGVVTGLPTQPAVVTSQPTIVTSQPAVVNLPAGFSGLTTQVFGNQSTTYSANSGTTIIVRSTPTPSASASGAQGSGTATGSASASASKGAAAGMHIKAGMGALAAAGGFFAIFL